MFTSSKKYILQYLAADNYRIEVREIKWFGFVETVKYCSMTNLGHTYWFGSADYWDFCIGTRKQATRMMDLITNGRTIRSVEVT